MIHDILQAVILLGSAVSIWLYTKPGRRRLWGYALNLSIEPIWFGVAWYSDQWGVALLAVWYSWCLISGIITEVRGKHAVT